MEYQQSCVTTAAYHHPIYAHHNQGFTHTHPLWSGVTQYHYGYERHALAPSEGGTLAQAPSPMTPDHTTPAGPVVLNDDNEYATVRPEQPLMYRNDVEIYFGQPTSPTVEFNVDELLVYQRRRSSATSEVKEVLTPAQRRRRAQNRAAQRAFRDRKRQRVQELEAQLSALEVRSNSLASDNERLQHELLRTREENEALRGIAQPQPSHKTMQPSRRRTTTNTDDMAYDRRIIDFDDLHP
ncbi:hypothetical protein M436DRAFT_34888 [Aureobasidium namibiae CBS 147.97]|uniref:BZIP domain-containing protein n=1 Tax=Aureobasidium namibiae CBS 147.97 TaxID=1043004 RepID=A0A074WYM1_9PEZI